MGLSVFFFLYEEASSLRPVVACAHVQPAVVYEWGVL